MSHPLTHTLPLKSATLPLARFHGKTQRYSPRLVVLVVMLFCVCAAQLTVRLAITNLGYRIAQLQQEVKVNDEQIRRLQYDYHAFNCPEKLAQRATNELGMKPFALTSVRKLTITNGNL